MKYFFWAFGLALFLCFSLASSTSALSYTRKSELVISGNTEPVSLFDGRFSGGASIAAGDLDGDGTDEWIVGAGPGGGPAVQIFSAAGKLQDTWFAYPESMHGGVNVAAGDLDGDGRAEIVVAPQSEMASEIKIYSDRRVIKAFLAWPSAYHEGANLAVLPQDEHGDGMIVVGSRGLRKNEVRLFSPAGRLKKAWLTSVARTVQTGVTVAAGWSDRWRQRVVIMGAGPGAAPRVMIRGLSANQNLAAWFAFNKKTRNGVNVAYHREQIVVSQQGHDQPIARTFSMHGQPVADTRLFEANFHGGLKLALMTQADQVVMAAVPTASKKNDPATDQKKIIIDLSDQTLTLYQHGRAISTRRISSGKWSTPTPIGTYKTKNKIPIAYSKPYNLYMEYWMAFTPDGKYGLHSLPFWKMKGGGRLYEGANHIGTPASHGCIRQTLADAKSLYNWAPIGTPVIIQK